MVKSKCFMLAEKLAIGKGNIYRHSQFHFYCKNEELRYYSDVENVYLMSFEEKN